jgi:hypothetical protein
MSILLTSLISREDLFKIKKPKATASYAPVPHQKVIEMTLEQLEKNGFRVISEGYHMARLGNQARGDYAIATKDKDMQIKLSWMNSYDKTMPLRWAVGGNVIICSNGMVLGDMGVFKRRHTGTVIEEYREAVHTHISTAGETFDKIVKEREQLKAIEINKQARAELIGRMFIEENVIHATQLGIMKKEIENPSFGDYGAPGTAWEVYNIGTVGMKEDHPSLYLDHHIRYHNFFKKEFELVS